MTVIKITTPTKWLATLPRTSPECLNIAATDGHAHIMPWTSHATKAQLLAQLLQHDSRNLCICINAISKEIICGTYKSNTGISRNVHIYTTNYTIVRSPADKRDNLPAAGVGGAETCLLCRQPATSRLCVTTHYTTTQRASTGAGVQHIYRIV